MEEKNKMVKLSQIFDIYTGSKLDYGKQTPADDGITFVSRNSNNNGVVGKEVSWSCFDDTFKERMRRLVYGDCK